MICHNESGHLIGEYDQNRNMIREYVWPGDRIVGMGSKDRPNVLLQVHTDHLGTARAVSEGNGTTGKVLWRFEGDAFGDALPNEDVDGDGIKFTMPIRMPGQYYDAEVGTSYNYFRDYDASTGRYVESDPIGLGGGLNTYGYVGGSPLKYADPLGLAVKCTIVYPFRFLPWAAQVCTDDPPRKTVVPPKPLVQPKPIVKECPPDDPDRCKKVRTECAKKCSKILPDTRDLQSMNFQKCYSECLEDEGCLGVKR